MKFIILEDITQDINFRKEAEEVWDKLKKMNLTIDSPGVVTSQLFGFIVIPLEILDPKYENVLDLMLERRFAGKIHKRNGALGNYKSNPNFKVIVLYCLEENRDFSELWTSNKIGEIDWEGVFVHEYIHYLDELRSSKGYEELSVEEKGAAEYYNMPSEFNAYYQELSHRIQKHIDFGMLDASRSIKSKKAYVKRNFKTYPVFIEKFYYLMDKRFISMLKPKYKEKFRRRLYGLYIYLKDYAEKEIERLEAEEKSK